MNVTSIENCCIDESLKQDRQAFVPAEPVMSPQDNAWLNGLDNLLLYS